MPSGARGFRVWWVLLTLCALVLTAADSLLLRTASGFLSSGFNSPHIDRIAFAVLFLPGSMLLDLWLVACIWLVAIPVARLLTRSPVQVVLCAALLGVGLPVAVAAFRYNVHSVVGSLFALLLYGRFSELERSELVLEVIADFPYAALAVLAGLLVSLLVLNVGKRIERHFGDRIAPLDPPPTRRLLGAAALLSVLMVVPIATAAVAGSVLRFGFERKVSGRIAVTLLDRATDLDLDGFGALSRPADPAPFDADAYPYALDVPGNGLDENGLAGDHPVDFRLPAPDPVAGTLAGTGARPHLLLIYLEGFRAETLEQRSRSGRPVAPFLAGLAREGSSSDHAYVHSPWTLSSRSQLFTGRLVPEPGAPTLIDDFQARGYTVAHFSGQDDSYGDSEALLGTARADAFYDARQDVARRTSRSTAPASLQVSWKTLTERIRAFLGNWDGDGPLFLYANVVDTHYPYWHPEIDDLLGVAELHRADIRSDNAEHVREAYANTVANVDMAVARIVAAFRERIGGADHAILVTADHGQALYHGGMLGHGRSLDASLTRVPFILWGVGGVWPEPIAPTDVRGLLARNLGLDRSADGVPRAHFVVEPARRVFQYAPGLERPTFLALQGVEDRLEYAFVPERLLRVDRAGERRPVELGEHRPAFEEMVRSWEALRAQSLRAGRQDAADPG